MRGWGFRQEGTVMRYHQITPDERDTLAAALRTHHPAIYEGVELAPAPQLVSAASAGEHVEGRTVAAAAGDLRAVAQHDGKVAVEHRLQLADATGFNDRRA